MNAEKNREEQETPTKRTAEEVSDDITKQTKKIHIEELPEMATPSTISFNLALDESAFQQHLRDKATNEAMKQAAAASWNKCKHGLERRAAELATNSDDLNKFKRICSDVLGSVNGFRMTMKSLQITVDMPVLFNLFKLRATADSTTLGRELEPFLITDEMREEANKAGIPLQLTVSYDKARFDEVELFFLNRDGGGIRSINIPYNKEDYEDDEDDDEVEIMDEFHSSCLAYYDASMDTKRFVLQPGLGSGMEDETSPDSISLQVKSLLPFEVKNLQQLRQLQSLQSETFRLRQRLEKVMAQKNKVLADKNAVEKKLTEAMQEKLNLEMQYKDGLEKLVKAENVASTQRTDIKSLKKRLKDLNPKYIKELRSKLEQKDKEIAELETELSKLDDTEMTETVQPEGSTGGETVSMETTSTQPEVPSVPSTSKSLSGH